MRLLHRHAAPPGRPSTRPGTFGLPAYGQLYRRRTDGRLFSVARVWTHDRQVLLHAVIGTEKQRPFQHELQRDYEEIV